MYSITPTLEQKQSPIDNKQFKEEKRPENDTEPIDEEMAKEDKNFNWTVLQSKSTELQCVSPKIGSNQCSLDRTFRAKRSSTDLPSKRNGKRSPRNIKGKNRFLREAHLPNGNSIVQKRK